MRVLIIEDNPDDARLMEIELQRYALPREDVQFEASKVYSTTIDLEAAMANQPDVVITDYVMPGGLSWPDIFFKIREMSDVPVIVVSGVKRDDQGMMAIQLGAADYISKSNLAGLGHAVHRAHLSYAAHKARDAVVASLASGQP